MPAPKVQAKHSDKTGLETVVDLAVGRFELRNGGAMVAERKQDLNVTAFDRYGLPDPSVFAYAIGAVELGCGVLLVLGLGTRSAALVIAANMVGALATGGRVDGGFVNLVLAPTLLVAMLVIVALGAGSWSLDGVLLWRRR